MVDPWVRPLVRELRSRVPCSMTKKLKKEKRKEGGETNHTHAYTPVPSSPTSVDIITAKETIGRKERRRKDGKGKKHEGKKYFVCSVTGLISNNTEKKKGKSFWR